ncbi:hypothetical protein CH063_03246 [Colletotrichum higginsianum]|uniref:Uncharacterized protein n=1 Tax=Colletotrichum higginsianum (strain IMI 349063) TaxID=759273 RepID=H1VV54_COLHI|nr:hypothetical protein CH063_03246 [Colletotrichum higginsianum]
MRLRRVYLTVRCIVSCRRPRPSSMSMRKYACYLRIVRLSLYPKHHLLDTIPQAESGLLTVKVPPCPLSSPLHATDCSPQ